MKRLQELREQYITHDGGPMDPRTYFAWIADFTEEQKRCFACSYFKGFRSKVPVCGADFCPFEEALRKEEEGKDGNKD